MTPKERVLVAAVNFVYAHKHLSTGEEADCRMALEKEVEDFNVGPKPEDQGEWKTVTTFTHKTLRDEFAIAALIGLGEEVTYVDKTSEWCFKVADAMMLARDKTQDNGGEG
jgi:hypothetical protein